MRVWLTGFALCLAAPAAACPITGDMRSLMLAPSEAAMLDIVRSCAATDFDFSATLPGDKIPFWHIVATYSSAEAVQIMLDAGADPNTTDRQGDPAVTAAINFVYDANDPAFLDMIRVLGDAGTDFSVPDSYGHTNLERAAGGGEIALLRLLLQYGADPNGLNPYGRTPLFETVFGTCRPQVGDTLIKAGGNITAMPADQIDRLFDEAAESCPNVAGGPAYVAQLQALRP